MAPRDLLLDLSARPVVAHRGASGLRPENTLAAFQLARELGAEAVEFDVRLSADGVPVVLHDPTLDRTTNLRGPVGAHPAAVLATADTGTEAGVPTVTEALEATAPLPVMIEIKDPVAAEPLRQVLRAAGAEPRVVVASFHRAAVAPFVGSSIPLGACRSQIAVGALAAAVGWPVGPVPWQFYGVPDRYKGWLPVPTRRFLARARRQGCPVHVWTVDDPAEARRFWERGASGIITNRPDLILAERNRIGPGSRSSVGHSPSEVAR